MAYSNLMYLPAAQVIAEITGKSWDEYLREQIFLPLGMVETNTSMQDLQTHSNVAAPHDFFHGEPQKVSWINLDNMGPAASINSNALEMARWVQFQLGAHEKKLLPPSLIEEMQTPQIAMTPNDYLKLYIPNGTSLSYGLGWMISDDRGLKMVEHLGNVGMLTFVSLIPEKNLGLVILTNCDKHLLTFALKNALLDHLLEESSLKESFEDWNAYYKNAYQKLMNQKLAMEKFVALQLGSGILRFPEPASLVGVYENPLYGPLTISAEDNHIRCRFVAFDEEIFHCHDQTFQTNEREYPTMNLSFYVIFSINSEGKREVRVFYPKIIDARFVQQN
jgi:hypothetical protein